MKIIKATINSDLSSESLKDALYQLNGLNEQTQCVILMIPMKEYFNAASIISEIEKEPITQPHHLWAKGLDIVINHLWDSDSSVWLLIGKEVIIENEGVK